jgi:6-phospho-beta-glucosidase
LNHLGWYIPESSDEFARLLDLAAGIDPEQVRMLEALPAPYVRYYVNPDRILERQRGAETRAGVLQRLEAQLLAGFAEPTVGEVPRRGAVWYRLAVVPLIDAWIHGSDVPVFAGTRNDGRVSGLPDSTVIEVPHVAPRPGVLVPLDPPQPHGIAAALLQHHAIYEALTAAAVLLGATARDRLRALFANPMVHSSDQARRLLERIEEGPPSMP